MAQDDTDAYLQDSALVALISAGEIDRAACEELINAATRQYAKRQETWFRREKWLEIVSR